MYCSRSDVEMIFGADNVEKWADLDNDADTDKIAARIEWAIELSQQTIDDELRGGPYEIPFDDSSASGSGSGAPVLVQDATARLAGVLLYEARGAIDWDPDDGKAGHVLQPHKDHVKRFINRVLTGRVRLDLTPTSTSYPRVIDADG